MRITVVAGVSCSSTGGSGGDSSSSSSKLRSSRHCCCCCFTLVTAAVSLLSSSPPPSLSSHCCCSASSITLCDTMLSCSLLPEGKGVPVTKKMHSIWRTEYVQFDMCGKTRQQFPYISSNKVYSATFPTYTSNLILN